MLETHKVTYNYNNGSLDTAHYVYTYDTSVSEPRLESDIEYTFYYNENGYISEVASKYNTEHNYTDDKHVYTYNDIYFYAE
ncbi:MAG: hypothetical protein IKM18_00060 [Clostridia bacterium]|nr:hypothetical protein [Clostridia bacterium]